MRVRTRIGSAPFPLPERRIARVRRPRPSRRRYLAVDPLRKYLGDVRGRSDDDDANHDDAPSASPWLLLDAAAAVEALTTDGYCVVPRNWYPPDEVLAEKAQDDPAFDALGDVWELLAARVFAPFFGTNELLCSREGFTFARPLLVKDASAADGAGEEGEGARRDSSGGPVCTVRRKRRDRTARRPRGGSGRSSGSAAGRSPARRGSTTTRASSRWRARRIQLPHSTTATAAEEVERRQRTAAPFFRPIASATEPTDPRRRASPPTGKGPFQEVRERRGGVERHRCCFWSNPVRTTSSTARAEAIASRTMESRTARDGAIALRRNHGVAVP